MSAQRQDTSDMNPWIAKALVLAATVVMIAVRAPHGRDSRRVTVIKSHKTQVETVILILAWTGFFIPLIWVVSPAFSFAEYPLRVVPLISGIVCFVIGLWLFYRSHTDLGAKSRTLRTAGPPKGGPHVPLLSASRVSAGSATSALIVGCRQGSLNLTSPTTDALRMSPKTCC